MLPEYETGELQTVYRAPPLGDDLSARLVARLQAEAARPRTRSTGIVTAMYSSPAAIFLSSAAIVALVIGGKILGIAGMILSIPAIGVLKIILSHSEHLKPFVILLEDKDPAPRNRPLMGSKAKVVESQKSEDQKVDEEIESNSGA